MKGNIFFFFYAAVCLVFFLSTSAGASHIRAEGDVFTGIDELGIIIGDIDSEMKFVAEDVKKHVYNGLKSKLPALKISSLSYPHLDVNIRCISEDNVHRACHIEIELRRIVFLPDKETFVAASVWNKSRLLQGDISFGKISEQLDIVLDTFSRDYLESKSNRQKERQ